jgi:hypothetical protein
MRKAGFLNVRIDLVRSTTKLDPADVRALYSTFSPIAVLPVGRRSRVLDAITEVAEDQFEGSVERPIQTILYTGQRS